MKFEANGLYRVPFTDGVTQCPIQIAKYTIVRQRDEKGKVIKDAPEVLEVFKAGVDPEVLLKIAIAEIAAQPKPSVDVEALRQIAFNELADEVAEEPVVKPKKKKKAEPKEE